MRPSDHRGGLVVAAPASGAGKTTVTLALIAVLRRRGVVVQPFKVGPDFIDAGHLSRAAGRPARALDGWMLGRDASLASFDAATADADCAIVEGMMGLYDGLSGGDETASTAEMAKWLGLPVMLVVDAGAMARSVAALVQGFRDFDRGVRLAAVVFNRVGGAGHVAFLREAMAATGVPCLGGLRVDEVCTIPERHLGLQTAIETAVPFERLADDAERDLDVDAVVALVRDDVSRPVIAVEGDASPPVIAVGRDHPSAPLIAVARDEAFSFYYPENLDALARAGARLVEWSPLRDAAPPPAATGVYLGGGYPELHARTLAANASMRAALRRFAADGGLVYAECGGLMLLGTSLIDAGGETHAMAGVLPFTTRMLPRGMTLGYREVEIDGVPWLPRLTARGHEFHHSTLDDATVPSSLGRAYAIRDPWSGVVGREGFTVARVLASYVHLHFGSAPTLAPALVEAARNAARERRDAVPAAVST